MRKILRSFVPASVQPVKLEKRADGQLPLITGYGAVFYQEGRDGTEYWLWDSFVERIDRSAFNRSVKEDDVRGLMNHDPNMLLGRTSSKTMRLSVDEVGLRYEIEPPDTQAGRDTVESIKRGDLTGSSFSFSILEERWKQDDSNGRTVSIRTLMDVQTYDVGPVTFPAYEATTTGVRHLRCIGDDRETEAKEAIERMKVKVEPASILTLDMIEARARVVAITSGLARSRA